MRGNSHAFLTRGFADRVNRAIDGEPIPAGGGLRRSPAQRWWRPFAGAAVAAGVAAVAVVALQQRAVAPTLRAGLPTVARNAATPAAPREAISYTVPSAAAAAPSAMPPARLTNYVFAHSKYSSGLDQRGVMADMLIEAEEQPAGDDPAAQPLAPRAAP